MATPSKEAIGTFISITGASEAAALLKLQEHGGDLNAAINAHFSEGDRNIVPEPSVATLEDDLMEIDDPLGVRTRGNPISPLLEASMTNPFSILNPHSGRNLFDGSSRFMAGAPFVSQPREVREIPIEMKDGGRPSHSAHAPVIEDVTESEQGQDTGVRGTVIVADEDEDDVSDGPIRPAHMNHQVASIPADSSRETISRPNASSYDDLPEYGNDIEEEMIRAAIDASKREAQLNMVPELSDPGPQQRHAQLDGAELEHAVSLSLQTAEQEKVLRDQKGKVEVAGAEASEPAEVELRQIGASNGRFATGNTSTQDDGSDSEEQPLVRHRSRRASSSSLESAREVGVVDSSPPSSPGRNGIGSQTNGQTFPSDEWGGISSEEHDEAVMLEAAMFGVSEETGYHFGYAPHQYMRQEAPFPRPVARPPLPSLQAQRDIREQQDDEYLASLAADREKEMKAKDEAEARRLQEQAVMKAAFEEEKRKEEESRQKLEEEQELERQLAAKKSSLPNEPAANNENAITLLVRMPDGTRHGRRFLKTNSLQSLFDFIETTRVVKPGAYRLVRPYPRRAFTDGDTALTFDELGLTSKQEALFLELI